ncbi:endonuclease/exonuclease/phosphatase family protein [Niabella terrae]
MKFVKLFGFLLVLVFMAQCSTGDAVDKQPEDTDQTDSSKNNLLVMTYNVHHCSPPDNPALIDVAAIAGVIKNSGADLVGLQEIDVNNSRSGMNLDQAARLGELTDMYFYFSKGIDYGGGAYGTALLSRYPISEKQTIALPKAEGTEQRTLSLVQVTLPEGPKIWFANTHLDYSSDANALAQAELIVARLKDKKEPVFITGDFNVVSNSATFGYLNQHFTSTCQGTCPSSFPAKAPTKAIDFIFYSKDKDIQVRRHEVVNEPEASDHRPVIAELAW